MNKEIKDVRVYCSIAPALTEAADVLSINYSNALQSFTGNSVVFIRKNARNQYRKFIHLKDRWKSETLFTSSGTDIISNGAYIKIIGLGTQAIPWIIKDLEKTNDHWFYALEKITGVNPIQQSHLGKVDEMTQDWVNWAKNHHYYAVG